ncbi:hypothetical protein COW38_03115, partial [Candidatus Collierbacteria bacterium CG17_big_fil_post_rev_8_21_14_2_50_45_7]
FGYKSDENNVYVVQNDDLRICYLGDLAKPLSEKVVSDLENIDVVIVSCDLMETKQVVE